MNSKSEESNSKSNLGKDAGSLINTGAPSRGSKKIIDQLQLVAPLLDSYLSELRQTEKFVGLSPNQVGLVFPNDDYLAAELLGNRAQAGIERVKFARPARDTL